MPIVKNEYTMDEGIHFILASHQPDRDILKVQNGIFGYTRIISDICYK